MPFPYDAADLAAIDRLANFYNGGDYDASTNPGGMGRGGHRVNFENVLADAARVGAANAAAAGAAEASATSAGESATAAALSAAKLIGSSASGVAIGDGSKAFDTQSGKLFAPGAFVLIYSAANPTVNYMAGQVTGYSGTVLNVNVTVAAGSGTFSDWVISVSAAPGAAGQPGPPGATGASSGLRWLFASITGDADPGAGNLRLNGATASATTHVYVDNLDATGASVVTWLDSFDDSTNFSLRGTLHLVQISDPSKFAVFHVTGAVVDGSGYRKIPVAFVAAGGDFVNGQPLSVSFTRTGNAGANGLGDVNGPGSSTDGNIVLFDGPTGRLLKDGGPVSALFYSPPNGRLTLTSGVAVTISDVVGATTIHYTPAVGNRVLLWNGSVLTSRTFVDLSLPLDSNSGHAGYHQAGLYDVFVFDRSGVVSLGTGPKWVTLLPAGSSVRGTGAGTTEIELFNGIWVNKNTITLRFGTNSGDTVSVGPRQATLVGSALMSADGQTADAKGMRYLSNAYNRVEKLIYRNTGTASWTNNSATPRIAGGDANNMVQLAICLPGDPVKVQAAARFSSSAATVRVGQTGIGLNQYATFNDTIRRTISVGSDGTSPAVPAFGHPTAEAILYPPAGFNFVAWMEAAEGADTQTFYGVANLTGISGTAWA